jgi:hypothetical protein
MNQNALKTLTGMTLTEALEKFQSPLEPAAYKGVPGGANLTDIDPSYLTEIATQVFGICGIGWFYTCRNPQVRSEPRSSSRREYAAYVASVELELRYRVWTIDESTMITSEPVLSTGGSENEVEAYAVRGALTNAIGAAFAKLCWQLPVYQGKLTHQNAGKVSAMAKAKESAMAQPKAEVVPAPAPAPAPRDPSTSSGHGAGNDQGEHVIQVGTTHKGKKVSALSPKDLTWFAEQMKASTPPAQAAQAACQAYLAAHPELRNGHVQAAVAAN